jgi:hypothetical protein
MDDEMMAEDTERDDFTMAAEEAFPDMAGDSLRIAALKEAIKLCLESDYDDKPKKGSDGLALIFGPGKKK